MILGPKNCMLNYSDISYLGRSSYNISAAVNNQPINNFNTFSSPPNTFHLGNLDTGSTDHFIAFHDNSCCKNVRKAHDHEKIIVTLPNGAKITSSHVGDLQIGPPEARKAHIFQDALHGSLISIGAFCDAGCTATYSRHVVHIYDRNNHLILSGTRSAATNNLWMVDMNKPSTHFSGASYGGLTHLEQRIQWLHRTYGSPVASTFIHALQRGWIKSPGMSIKTIQSHVHILNSTQTADGHLDQARQNVQSTTKSRRHRSTNPDAGPADSRILTKVIDRNHMDATGRFPVPAIDGSQYIMILYSEYGNYIKPIAMANRTTASMVAVYEEALHFFEAKGLKPTFQRLDNEISAPYISLLTKHDIVLDLVPPGQHRRNKAERAIRTFKNHFISILSGVDPDFPANLWATLLEQTELTINLLRESTCHPRISAWEEINGAFNFNATPIAPLGMKVTVHDKPQQRGSWSTHGHTGFYTGPAMHHYRCYTTRIQSTGAQRITDTLAWHPHGFSLPTATPLELVSDAASSLTDALHLLAKSNIVAAVNAQPLHDLISSTQDNLKNLVTFFSIGTAPPRDEPATTHASSQRVAGEVPTRAPIERVDVPASIPTLSERVHDPAPVTSIERVDLPAPIHTSVERVDVEAPTHTSSARVDEEVFTSSRQSRPSSSVPDVPPGFATLDVPLAPFRPTAASRKANFRKRDTTALTGHNPRRSTRGRHPNRHYCSELSHTTAFPSWDLPTTILSPHTNHFACTAIDLDSQGKRLNIRRSFKRTLCAKTHVDHLSGYLIGRGRYILPK